ncbi:uncharacterized protein EI90DRAFT_838986 [Cantharellus anzutake]|uniref:uncharacterized protein n=1 Tax=Cantharellus anzutake TaxID=1750568 RepID=UPI0019063181|nr:uncharacterized protein EI90DRAFT_838986 [Cantharellus anzutake]KAF8343185.1 hypothetical protein EI90DRAFT_838986 [Cantharellus anzutake]
MESSWLRPHWATFKRGLPLLYPPGEALSAVMQSSSVLAPHDPMPASTAPATSNRPPLLRLPVELMQKISFQLLVEVHGHVVEAFDLASFSSTCKDIRLLTEPVLFREISVFEERDLLSVSRIPRRLLSQLRALVIFLDPPFVAAWKDTRNFISEASFPPPGPPIYPLIYIPLARIIANAPLIQSLSFKMAESTGPGSAWRKFSLTSHLLPNTGLTPITPSPLTLDPHLHAALSMPLLGLPNTLLLPNVTRLHLDSFEGVDALLKLTPNLKELRVRNSGGFDIHCTRRFVKGLEYVRSVEVLEFMPEGLTLRAEETTGGEEFPAGPLGLLTAIGNTLPNLKSLSLRTCWFGYGISFVSFSIEEKVRLSNLCPTNLRKSPPAGPIRGPLHTHKPDASAPSRQPHHAEGI